MDALLALARVLDWINSRLLRVGRAIGVVAIAIMVAAILIQVFFRYVLNSALPWPDEAARFCMLWMTGLMAPTALRNGSFVAIDTVETLLPSNILRVLQLFLMIIGLVVLLMAAQIGFKEVTGIGGRFTTASLYLPTSFSFDSWYRIPRSWMMMSLLVGVWLLILVNVELIIRNLLSYSGRDELLPSPDYANSARSE